MTGDVLGEEGREFGRIFLDHAVSLPDEVIIVVARLVEPVDILLTEDARLLQTVLQLLQIASHKAAVLFRPLDETGELSFLAAVEGPAAKAFGPHPVSGESIFPEILLCGRDEVREVEGDIDLVSIHFEVSFRKQIHPLTILVQSEVVEPHGAKVVSRRKPVRWIEMDAHLGSLRRQRAQVV